jgi:cytochrome c553
MKDTAGPTITTSDSAGNESGATAIAAVPAGSRRQVKGSRGWPPDVVRCGACHAAKAASSDQSVRLLRRFRQRYA